MTLYLEYVQQFFDATGVSVIYCYFCLQHSSKDFILLKAAFPDSAAIASSIDNVLPYIMMQLTDAEKAALGYQLNDTVIKCFYDGKPCEIQKYMPHVTVTKSYKN